MKIDIQLIKEVINVQLEEILKELESGFSEKHEIILKLGTISSLVIELRDRARKEGYSENDLEYIWDLKKEVENNLQLFLEEWINYT